MLRLGEFRASMHDFSLNEPSIIRKSDGSFGLKSCIGVQCVRGVRPVFSFGVYQLGVYRQTLKSTKMVFSFRGRHVFGFVGEFSTNLWPFSGGLWRAFQPPLFGAGFTARRPSLQASDEKRTGPYMPVAL